ncbi:coiled-coil protein [Legionella gratiana]|uniref:Coiled-coil protein n=1 Tax=Legionella gratiana TaxID=45066 RepID=A0A378JEX5_9GAMM|nr:helicase-related protein [Legionella gratiana]KTD11770.1 coiled-coil protein [Legionella gratiana]STX45447.1 coiled-coil protein [Legionella gratiana]
MTQSSKNRYIQSLLENLITSYETEINYSPIEVELDQTQISAKDIDVLLGFVSEPRKRLFIFKIPGQEQASNQLALIARRTVLNKTAETILQNISSEPKIYPLKKALATNSQSVRARIQIQKSFVLPKAPSIQQDTRNEHVEHIATEAPILIPIELPEFPRLTQQLKALGINYLQESAVLKIKEFSYAFLDGIIPNNLPKGFYINKDKQALCYTDTPRKLPSPLAPILKKQDPLILLSTELVASIVPNIPQNTLALLMETHYSTAQKNALISLFPQYEDEVKTLLQINKPNAQALISQKQIQSLVPFLCKQVILGGEAHTLLLVRLLNTCLNKKISLDFLKNPGVQNSLLTTRGIKNLQKLVRLPAEQKEWWNVLATAHLNYDKNSFDFNTFFEAYTQVFLPRIAEKNLTLPNPCPIEYNGHLLITLNRILDVIEHAENPQEQCLSLTQLNWGPTGVHHAMTQKSASEQFKQVASCMKIENSEDTITDPALMYQQIENEHCELTPWLFRYMGQHWHKELRLSDIQDQLHEIEKLHSWTPIQRKQLIFILTCTFADKTTVSVEQWKKNLLGCIHSLQQLHKNHRSDLLQAFSRCFTFKPTPSLAQIDFLLKQCMDIKKVLPNKNFKNDLLNPLISCLENEGFDVFNTLQERIQKTTPSLDDNLYSPSVINSFTTIIQENRHSLSFDLIKLLTKLNEPILTQLNIDNLLLALQRLHTQKGDEFSKIVVSTLSQINLSKSQSLPKIEQIQTLIETLTNASDSIPTEHKTVEKQEAWLKEYIIEKNLLPGCVIGNGDISKLDDLIVDALVDAIKKRSAAFKIDTLKAVLQKNLQSFIVPQQLREQLNQELIPLFDAVNDLVTLLQSPNPKFPDVIDKLRFFEEKKPILLNGMYGVGILGKTKGAYILSFLLTGKRNANDNTTGSAFATILSQLHGLFISEMNAFFGNPQNKLLVKDLDINTSLSWMAAFNDTHSLTFFFKEELIQKKVLPALKKTLQQLNTQDPDFERSILNEAALLVENAPSDQSLQDYKNKIESIAKYLNLLIDIHERLPEQFNKIYKQLNSGALTRLNYTQKQILINELIQDNTAHLDLYLKLTTQALEENPDADSAAIERGVNGLVELFELTDLDPEAQVMFFKMSMAHNLKSTSPFPLAALNELKKSNLPENIKSLIIKKIIHILTDLSGTASPELVQNLVQQTQLFLTHNQDQAELCIALLNRFSPENPDQDLNAYPLILQQLAQINQENRAKIATILTGLAQNRKDYTVNLFALLEVTKGLGRRSSADIDQVLKLFTTPPYPNTQSLNSALLAHDSEKLRAYCLSFDTNPFAKTGEQRDLSKQFATDRVKEALISLQDLLCETDLPHSLQLKLAKQLTFIETLGYTDPLNPYDFKTLKKLTASSRHDLKERAKTLLDQLRSKSIDPEQIEITYLELLAYLREIYFRTTGLFPNTTQMLVLLLALNDPSSNLLMRIKTGEGKSINTPMLSVLQWTQGGTIDQCTANPQLLIRDFENNCEPFFNFLEIKTALIQRDSPPEAYQHDGINCSTIEDMAFFRLSAKESKKEKVLETNGPIHVVLDECDDALLDQVTLYKLVAETENHDNNPAEWIYPLAYQFINLPAFRNIDPEQGKVWDEEEDLEQFRLFLNKEINEQFKGSVEKQNYLMASSNTQLKQWIHASCIAATLVENKHFIIQPLKEKDESGHEATKKIICVPLIRSTPKTGSIFTEAVQQALQARLKAERKDHAQYFVIDPVPAVLSNQSARGLIKFYQHTKGRLLGISATPGDKRELESLATAIGTQAISVAPYAGDKRINHEPVFTLNREETIQAIHKTLNKIKCPITKPTMEINPDAEIQTYAEREALITQTKSAIEKWSHTQTQPILVISEDFDEAQALSSSLKTYKEQGFKIQTITGKESPSELDRIIKQAGQVNTITVGTAMLAKGIDINTGDHPKGLFVVQTYPDTERMTTQIAGRAARNGKPGEWLPIYQVKPPKDLLSQFFYYVIPWRRQRINERTVELLKNKIKSQATIDGLYTQAIDEAQQILMQQIEAWEGLLLELYPNDPKIQFEFYQWREALLGELTRSQETSITESTLAASINQFKNAACKLWEIAREEKWTAKAEKATHITNEQSLRLKYLKQLDFAQELNVQTQLQQKSKPFTDATKALMQQNLETIIADKAGAVLDYTRPVGQMKTDLELAQSKQILPRLIGEFCTACPEAIEKFFPNHSQNSSFIPEIITQVINKVIEKKNKILYNEEKEEITESIIQYYQKKLMKADSNKVKELLSQMKPLMLHHCQESTRFSIVEQFKIQGLVLNFCTLYQNSGLPADTHLKNLQIHYNEEIMKQLAQRLCAELSWIKEKPEPFHALFERTVAKEAALALYNLAEDVITSCQDQNKIQALYTGLKKHQAILKDKYLFSVGHSSPRTIINDAVHAIDSLTHPLHCDLNFRQNCHDKVVSEYHITAFRHYLAKTSPYFFKTYDPIWNHLQETLLNISHQSQDNPNHIIQELYEATERFSTYEAYKPYLGQLKALKKKLLNSIKEFNKTDGLHQNTLENLLTQKTTRLAHLLNVNPEQIRIQNGTDGIQSYIEIQVADAPLKEGFTGYQSSFLTRVENERNELKKLKTALEENKEALLNLSDKSAIEILPLPKHAEFEKLFRLKALLTEDWNSINIDRSELPEFIQKRLTQIDEMKLWDWTKNPVDLNQLKTMLHKNPDELFNELIKEQSRIDKNIEDARSKIRNTEEQIRIQEKEVLEIGTKIKAAQERRQQSNCGYIESASLMSQILYHQGRIIYINQLIAQYKRLIQETQKEEIECIDELRSHNQLLDDKRIELIAEHLQQTKYELISSLQETCKQQIIEIQKELQITEPAIEALEKTEHQKSRYQTQRFFKTSELLKYEASLSHEEELIPKKTSLQSVHSSQSNLINEEEHQVATLT